MENPSNEPRSPYDKWLKFFSVETIFKIALFSLFVLLLVALNQVTDILIDALRKITALSPDPIAIVVGVVFLGILSLVGVPILPAVVASASIGVSIWFLIQSLF